MRDILDPIDLWIGTPGRAQVFGNKAPVALDDTLIVERDSGPVSVDVLANDFDPEGGALTLTDAFAALGTAVAEPNNTVTYTPPAGISGFDTVVYEIADAEDQRRSGQINISITEPEQTLVIETLSNNTLSVAADPGPLTITVTAPATYSGTYPFDTGDLAAGPLALAPPTIEGTLNSGDVLIGVPGLWAHDTGAGAPTASYQWQRGGNDIPGATSLAYTVTGADLAPGLRLVETLTDGFGAQSATSAQLSGAGGSFLPDDDVALQGWFDAAETATITQDAGEVTAWADRSGGAPLTQTSPVLVPSTGARSLNGLNLIDFDGSRYMERSETVSASGNVAFHAVMMIDATANAFEAILALEAGADFQLDANHAAQFDGRLNLTGTGTALPLSGGPISGAFILSIVFDYTGAGAVEVFTDGDSLGAPANTAPIDISAALHLMTNRSKNASVDGAVGELIVTGDVTNRAAYHDYLALKWGLI